MVFHYRLLKRLRLGGTAVGVDVHAVRLRVNGDDLRAQLVKKHRGNGRRRAVCAVEHDFQPLEVAAALGFEQVEIGSAHLRAGFNAADVLSFGRRHARAAAADDRFDLVLQRIRELITLSAEEFDAVVFGGIVGCGDHDPGIGLYLPIKHRDGRGRNHAQIHRVRADRADARHQRALEHITGDARIGTDEHCRPVRAGDQHLRARAAQLIGQRAIQFRIGNSSDTVGAEHSRHIWFPPEKIRLFPLSYFYAV